MTSDQIHIAPEDVAAYLMACEQEAHQMSPEEAAKLRGHARKVVDSVKWCVQNVPTLGPQSALRAENH